MRFGKRRKHDEASRAPQVQAEAGVPSVAAADPGPVPAEWADLERELIEHAGRLIENPAAAVVVAIEGSEHYVQWHGVDDQSLAGEASAGLATGRYDSLTPEQKEQLAALGWAPPRTERPFPTPNWHRYWVVRFDPDARLTVTTRMDPFDAAGAARVMVHTLRLVYGAEPSQIRVNPLR